MSDNPFISVIMPVYNTEKYIAETIDSLLHQTFADFELLITDDASTDNTISLIKSYTDKRIILIENKENIGLTRSLNKTLAYAKGKYIARLDGDDIAMPQRFEKQVDFLENHPEVGLCGSWIAHFGENHPTSIYRTFEKPAEINCRLLFSSAIAHSAMMMRKTLMEENQLRYDETYPYSQDYAMWVAVFKNKLTLMYNIPEVLVHKRLHKESISAVKKELQTACSLRSKIEMLDCLKINPTEAEAVFHHQLNYPIKGNIDMEFLYQLDKWFLKIKSANDSEEIFDREILFEMLQEKWEKYAAGNTSLGMEFHRLYKKSIFSSFEKMSYLNKISFFFKCLLKK